MTKLTLIEGGKKELKFDPLTAFVSKDWFEQLANETMYSVQMYNGNSHEIEIVELLATTFTLLTNDTLHEEIEQEYLEFLVERIPQVMNIFRARYYGVDK